MKVLLGVVAGLMVTILIVALSTRLGTVIFGEGVNPPYLIFNIATSVLAAVAGGYATTGFGNATSRTPAVILAGLFMVLGLQAVLSGPVEGQPGWYPVLMLLIAPPAIFGGAEMALRRRQRSNPPEA